MTKFRQSLKLVRVVNNNEIEIVEAIHIRKNRNKNLMNEGNNQLNLYFFI